MNKTPPKLGDRLYPWERMEGEGTKAFEAFNQYRGLPAKGRSVYQAWFNFVGNTDPERYSKNINGRYPPMSWGGWSKKFQWPLRAASWDEYTQKIKDEIELELEKEEYRHFRRTLRQVAMSIIQSSIKIDKAINRRLANDGSEVPPIAEVTVFDKVSSTHFKNASSIKIASEILGGAIGADRLVQFLEQEGLMDDVDIEG